jgi:type VI secretion system protein ImpK
MAGTSGGRLWTRILGVAVVLSGLALGGCKNVSREQYDLAVQEAQSLRTENAALKESDRSKDAQIATLQQQIATPANPGPASGWDNGGGGGSSRPTDTGGGSQTYTLGGVAFGSGSATLTSSARKELDKIAADIKRRHGGASVRVEGHTDSTPIKKSKWSSNEALSQARADSVREYLIQKGISSGRIDSIGFGSSKPKGSATASRRVEIVVMGS